MPRSGIKKYLVPIIVFSIVLLLFIAIILIDLRTDTKNKENGKKELKEITIDGILYVFNTNIYEVIRVKSEGDDEIKDIFERNNRICIKFDNSSSEDNSLFLVSSFNIVYKTTRYYISRGVEKKIEVCNEEPKIDIIGPNTGARETSVRLVNKTIVIQGTTPKNLEMATDKLILIVLGFREA